MTASVIVLLHHDHVLYLLRNGRIELILALGASKRKEEERVRNISSSVGVGRGGQENSVVRREKT
jgi:hypothetical protein